MADLFDKANEFTRADDIKKAGLYPYFRAIEGNEGPIILMDGKEVIMAGSNNYLGLANHPKVVEAAINAIKKYGTSCSGSRYLTGTLDLHIKLEERLAAFLGYEQCLLISTGYQTAQAIIPTLVHNDEMIISDKDNHACILMANMMAVGMKSKMARYKHNTPSHLETVISHLPYDIGKLIVTDGVFSTTGEVVNLPEIVRIARKYNARIMIDDAHATGVVGLGGRGTASKYGLTKDTDITMGTFSKSFSSLGGFIASTSRVINYIKHTSPALIFSASPTPASVASALASLEIIEEQPDLIEKLHCNANKVRDGLNALGFKTIGNPETGIVSVILGDTDLTLIFTKALFEAGIFVNAFVRPGVPPGMEMLRTSYMASHKDEHLEKILTAFERIGTRLGVINPSRPV